MLEDFATFLPSSSNPKRGTEFVMANPVRIAAGESAMATRNPVRRRIPKTSHPTNTTDVIRFDADRLISGITYHLIDSAIALEVDAPSVKAIASCLHDSGAEATVTRADWTQMDNGERFQWLLLHAGITIEQHDGIAKLS
jgi:hypothetical protein